MKRIVPILILILSLCICTAASADDAHPLRLKRGATKKSGAAKDKSELNEFMLALINQDRARHKADPVEENAALSKVAQAYANYLMRTGEFAHVDSTGRNPQDRARQMGVQVFVAENLAWQMDTELPAKTLLKKAQADMMNEPPGQMNHRGNITNPNHRYVGIGIARSDDAVILVQEFSEQRP
jgi:uncharacterized protein YkwD